MATTKTGKNFSIDISIVEMLEEYSAETDIPQSKIVNRALKQFFENKKLPHKKEKN